MCEAVCLDSIEFDGDRLHNRVADCVQECRIEHGAHEMDDGQCGGGFDSALMHVCVRPCVWIRLSLSVDRLHTWVADCVNICPIVPYGRSLQTSSKHRDW